MEHYRLEPVRVGFPYELGLIFPAGFLAAGDTVRASLRKTPNDSASLVDFSASRLGDTVTLSLTKTQTAALAPARGLVDLVLVDASNVQNAIPTPRLLADVELHGTRNSNP